MASRNLHRFIVIFTFATLTTVHRSQDDSSYNYDLCAPFPCGGIHFSFPFSKVSPTVSPLPCGVPGFRITCDASDTPYLLLGLSLYRVKSLSLTGRILTLVNTELIDNLSNTSCTYLQKSIVVPPLSPASGVGYNLSRTGSIVELSFYICNLNRIVANPPPRDFLDSQVISYTCTLDCCERQTVYLYQNTTQTNSPHQMLDCKQVTVPGSDDADKYLFRANGTDQGRSRLADALSNAGFSLTWPSIPECSNCQRMNGRCGYIKNVTCFFQGGRQNNNLTKRKATGRRRIIVIGAASGSSLLALIVASLLLGKKWFLVQRGNSRYDGPDAEELIRTCRSTLLMNYSFEDLKKMTRNFNRKVGEGGYGRVYRGMLADGRVVAVKLLDKLNNESQDFANEVGTIGRIHHLNIIRLLGFCYEGAKRALVYEFMPNGSLGDYLHERGCVSLRVDRLMEIALGIARGIEYLHTGCESRILHLDIKPHNILLDEDFIPKISDFGLAKMHSRQKSAISMSGARGTVGFIAPEVFLRNFGNPSHKSDVYSFGMLLVEMVGMRTRNAKTSAPSSEKYFPSWIYEEVGNSAEGASRKLSMIALWCIQMNPRDRPSMTEVLDMLSGSADQIPMPPKPVVFSPPRQESILEVESASNDEEALMVL